MVKKASTEIASQITTDEKNRRGAGKNERNTDVSTRGLGEFF
jgi:hypothetical protein